MKKTIVLILKYSLFIGIVWFLYLILYPRKYNVLGFEEIENVAYWQLSAGNKIGYVKVDGQFLKQPYPIIYLHGGPGGMITNAIVESLSALSMIGYDLYFYNQIGSGYSDRLCDISDYSVERHQSDLEEIIDQLGVEKVILIGHSWGAMLSIQYLEEHPEKVERMVLTGPGPILPINQKLSQQKAPDSLALRPPHYSNHEGNEKANNWRSKFIQYGAYITGRKMTSDKEADNFFTYLNSELNKSTLCDTSKINQSKGGGGYYSHIMTLKSFHTVSDKRAEIRGLPIPILLLRGQCDNQKWGFAKEYLDLFPNARLEVVTDAGHSIYKERPEVYENLVRAFLEKAL